MGSSSRDTASFASDLGLGISVFGGTLNLGTAGASPRIGGRALGANRIALSLSSYLTRGTQKEAPAKVGDRGSQPKE
jgi:hypothetical protein